MSGVNKTPSKSQMSTKIKVSITGNSNSSPHPPLSKSDEHFYKGLENFMIYNQIHETEVIKNTTILNGKLKI